jgi:hypothetical protein
LFWGWLFWGWLFWGWLFCGWAFGDWLSRRRHTAALGWDNLPEAPDEPPG